MFERLFTRPWILSRHRDGPAAEERRRFLHHLADQGLSTTSLLRTAAYLLVIARALRVADRPDKTIRLEEVERQALRWATRPGAVRNRQPGHSSRGRFLGHAIRWLRFLGRLVPPAAPANPFAARVAAFADYMRSERGLSPSTIRNRCWIVQGCLDRLDLSDGCLRDITINQIDALFLGMAAPDGYARSSVQQFASALRAFFRFAEICGWCRAGLAVAIQSPRVFSQASLPMGPSWDEVRQLLRSTEGDRPADIRDRAILLLLAIYGLRSSEVRRLRLADLDWERERLVVTSAKNGQGRTYPLTHPVGDAILRYLKEVRPRSAHREVFLTLLPPARPLSELWAVVSERLRRSEASLPHRGPHALRHACATHLLEQGLSLKEIGDHLGHHDPDATRIYAKVDLNGLRQVADFDLGGLL